MRYKIKFWDTANHVCQGTWEMTRKNGITRQDVKDVIAECRLLNEVFRVQQVRAEIIPLVGWPRPVEVTLESATYPGRYPLRRLYIGTYGSMPVKVREWEVRS